MYLGGVVAFESLDIGFYLVSNPTADGFVKASVAPFNLTFLLGTSHQPTPAIPPKIVAPHPVSIPLAADHVSC